MTRFELAQERQVIRIQLRETTAGERLDKTESRHPARIDAAKMRVDPASHRISIPRRREAEYLGTGKRTDARGESRQCRARAAGERDGIEAATRPAANELTEPAAALETLRIVCAFRHDERGRVLRGEPGNPTRLRQSAVRGAGNEMQTHPPAKRISQRRAQFAWFLAPNHPDRRTAERATDCGERVQVIGVGSAKTQNGVAATLQGVSKVEQELERLVATPERMQHIETKEMNFDARGGKQWIVETLDGNPRRAVTRQLPRQALEFEEAARVQADLSASVELRGTCLWISQRSCRPATNSLGFSTRFSGLAQGLPLPEVP